MSKTIFGTFDETYHHIDAPTNEDIKYREKYHTRKLITNPIYEEHYRNPAFYNLRDDIWLATRKLDGTNIRIKWDGEQAVVAGKTNNANLDSLGNGFKEYMEAHFLEERFEEKFGRDKTVIIYGEWVGNKVQGNELGLDGNELVIFDVQINGVWLDYRAVVDVAMFFECSSKLTYTRHKIIEAPLYQLIHDVAKGYHIDWEGLVAEPRGQFKDRTGNRIICKIKNKDYYRGSGYKEMMVAHLIPVREISDYQALYDETNWQVRCIYCERRLNREEQLRRQIQKRTIPNSPPLPCYEVQVHNTYDDTIARLVRVIREKMGKKTRKKKYWKTLTHETVSAQLDKFLLAKGAARIIMLTSSVPTYEQIVAHIEKDVFIQLYFEMTGEKL